MRFHAAVALVLLAIVAALLGGGRATNSIWGRMGRSDQLLQKRKVFRKPEKFHMQIYKFSFPVRYTRHSPVISAVKAIDHDRKNEASALLTQGGPGHRNVTVHLIAQHSCGLDFTIEVWSSKH